MNDISKKTTGVIMEREIRRNQNNLVILGTGVLAFGAWTVIRSLALYLIQRSEIERMVASAVPEDLAAMVMAAMTGIIVVVLAIDLIFRIIVGFSARAEGKGRKKHAIYLAAAVLLIVIHAISIGTGIAAIFADPEGIVESIIGAVIDFTSAITLVQLIMASVRLRKLTAQKQ